MIVLQNKDLFLTNYVIGIHNSICSQLKLEAVTSLLMPYLLFVEALPLELIVLSLQNKDLFKNIKF